MCSALVTPGVGLRLRPQLLPSVPGCVLCPAAAKEESLCRDGTKRGEAHLLYSLLLRMLHLLLFNKKCSRKRLDSFWSSSLALIVFPNWSLFSPCPLVAPKRTQTSQRSPLRSHPGPCGRFPLRNYGNEEAAAPPCLSTSPRPPRPSKAPPSASLKRWTAGSEEGEKTTLRQERAKDWSAMSLPRSHTLMQISSKTTIKCELLSTLKRPSGRIFVM